MNNIGVLKFLNAIFQVTDITGSSKGTVVLILLLIDALAFAFSLKGKTKDGTITSWPLFWFSIILLFFIIWYASH